MYLIKKWWLIISFIVAFLIVLMVALDSYFIFRLTVRQENLSLKFFVENIIFYTVLGLIALTGLAYLTFQRSKAIYRELDKIIEISHQGKQPVYLYLERLGELGLKISQINRHLDELNVVKTLKISALSKLYSFLVEKTNHYLLITDIEGKILAASKPVLSETSQIEKNWQGLPLDKFFGGFDFSEMLNNLRHSKSVAVRAHLNLEPIPGTDFIMTFYPITNSRNELSYCVGLKQGEPENNQPNLQ